MSLCANVGPQPLLYLKNKNFYPCDARLARKGVCGVNIVEDEWRGESQSSLMSEAPQCGFCNTVSMH